MPLEFQIGFCGQNGYYPAGIVDIYQVAVSAEDDAGLFAGCSQNISHAGGLWTKLPGAVAYMYNAAGMRVTISSYCLPTGDIDICASVVRAGNSSHHLDPVVILINDNRILPV